MSEVKTIQSLEKLLVDVPKGKGDEFMSTYGPGAPNRRTDFDDKLVFVHDRKAIVTQGEIFGGNSTTVGPHNSFVIGDTTYVLTIKDGELNIEGGTSSYFGEGTAWIESSVSGEGTQVYQSTYTIAITPSNRLGVEIISGSKQVVLTGITLSDTINQSWSYLTGGETKVIDGIAYRNDKELQYNQAGVTVSEFYNVPNNGSAVSNHYVSSKTVTGILSSTKTVNVATQYAKVYYHEKGRNELYSTTIESSPVSATVEAVFDFLHMVGAAWSETTATSVQCEGLPITENIEYEFIDENSYGWFACPTEWLTNRTTMPTFTEYDEDGNKGAEGGWYFETIAGSIYRFTRGGIEYTLMRTVNPVLETTYYRVKK